MMWPALLSQTPIMNPSKTRYSDCQSPALRSALGALDERYTEATATTALAPYLDAEPQAPAVPSAKPQSVSPKAIERLLRHLVAFAQHGPTELKERAWSAPLRQVALMLQRAGAIATDDLDSDIENPEELAAEIHRGLNALVDGGEWETPPLTVRRWLFPSKDGGFQAVVIGATQRDAILLGLTEILTRHAQRIRRCAADDCVRIFLARKSQYYCGSKRCHEWALRAAQQRFIKAKNRSTEGGYGEYRKSNRDLRKKLKENARRASRKKPKLAPPPPPRIEMVRRARAPQSRRARRP